MHCQKTHFVLRFLKWWLDSWGEGALGDTVDQPELESERSISYEIPPQIEESSIEEPVILDNMIDLQPPSITYEIVDTCMYQERSEE